MGAASSALAFREGVFAIASGFYDMVLVGGEEEMSKRTTEEVAEGLALATLPYPGRADARIESVDCARPENIKVGMALKVKYLLREERGKRRPIWHSSLSKRGEYYATQG